MDDHSLPKVVPVEASDATGTVICRPKLAGKGLSWNEEENIALAKSAYEVCQDPAVGAGMKTTDMYKKIRSLFINDSVKPEGACTTCDKGPLDSRRWGGRSFLACGKQWKALLRECEKFKGCIDRVHRIRLTGNPTDEDIYRCASLLYSDGIQSSSHIYDCLRNPAYPITKPFKFDKTFAFLLKNTTILEAGGLSPDETKKLQRPIGRTAAKKLEEAKREERSSDENSSMANSIHRIEKLLADNAAHRHEFSRQTITLQRERMEWEMAKTLMGPGSNVSVEERETISSLLRKRLFASLSKDVAGRAGKKHCTDKGENEHLGVSALLKISSMSAPSSQDIVSSVSGDKGSLNC